MSDGRIFVEQRARIIVSCRPGTDPCPFLRTTHCLYRLGHIFDGVTLHRDIGNYQLIDIHDPLLSSMIHDERARKAQPDFLSGWFKLKQFNIIKAVLRRKWLALTDGTVCSDAECADLLEEFRDFENFQGTGVNMGMGGGQRFETEEPGENSEAGSSTPGPSMSRRKGRPRGGGGYAAGTVPGGTTVRAAVPRQDRWKRKGVARLPLREEEQAVSTKQSHFLRNYPWGLTESINAHFLFVLL